jgi:hypothetical protein
MAGVCALTIPKLPAMASNIIINVFFMLMIFELYWFLEMQRSIS